MRFGCCDGPEADLAPVLLDVGYDYFEMPLNQIATLGAAEFDALARKVAASALPCEACNCFFPSTIRLTGAEATPALALDYVRLALGRASALGVKVVVFGSGAARQVPTGFPKEDALRQLARLLSAVGDIAEANDITIAIEPLGAIECNIVNTVPEGTLLADAVGHPRVLVLADIYHMVEMGEDLGFPATLGARLGHAHFCSPITRQLPAEGEAAGEPGGYFEAFFSGIAKAPRVSLEAGFASHTPADRRAELAAALRVMRALA